MSAMLRHARRHPDALDDGTGVITRCGARVTMAETSDDDALAAPCCSMIAADRPDAGKCETVEPQSCPNPDCSGSPSMDTADSDTITWYWMACMQCGVSGSTRDAPAGAIAQWNMLSMKRRPSAAFAHVFSVTGCTGCRFAQHGDGVAWCSATNDGDAIPLSDATQANGLPDVAPEMCPLRRGSIAVVLR